MDLAKRQLVHIRNGARRGPFGIGVLKQEVARVVRHVVSEQPLEQITGVGLHVVHLHRLEMLPPAAGRGCAAGKPRIGTRTQHRTGRLGRWTQRQMHDRQRGRENDCTNENAM